LGQRAAREFKELLALAAYLYVSLGAVVLLKSAILQDAGISFPIWGIAAAKAFILAKFMLLARAFHLGERYHDQPLIWPTLYRSLILLIILLILTTAEELLVGLFRTRTLADSLAHVVGPTFFQGLAVSFVMFLILMPYSAFMCLSEVLGEGKLLRLFFVERPPARTGSWPDSGQQHENVSR
jgi:hypothetical protein